MQEQKKKKTFARDDSDDDDAGKKRVVKSHKDKRFDELVDIIKLVKNAMRNSDWNTIHDRARPALADRPNWEFVSSSHNSCICPDFAR